MPRRERCLIGKIHKWCVVIDDGYGFPHAYEVKASDRLSVNMLMMGMIAGLRFLGVTPEIKDLHCYLGTTQPIRPRRRVKK